jgi:transcription antitermination protein NusB
MTNSSPTSLSPALLDEIRTLAFRRVLLLSGATDDVEAPDAALESLAPSHRELAYQVAGRRLSFQLLYELEVGGIKDDHAETFVLHALSSITDLGPIAADKVRALTLGAFVGRAQADKVFAELAPDWPTHRQAAVDRAILRLGYYEIHSRTTPAKIAVNEAVELAKWFSTDKSPAFVNGLLDKVLHHLESGESNPAPTA